VQGGRGATLRPAAGSDKSNKTRKTSALLHAAVISKCEPCENILSESIHFSFLESIDLEFRCLACHVWRAIPDPETSDAVARLGVLVVGACRSHALTLASGPMTEPDPELEPEQIRREARANPRWVPDSEATACMLCEQTFSFMAKRHHCRYCGALLCDACSRRRMCLDRWMLDNGRTARPKLRSAAELSRRSKPKRVCDSCFTAAPDEMEARAQALASESEWKRAEVQAAAAMGGGGAGRMPWQHPQHYTVVRLATVREGKALTGSAEILTLDPGNFVHCPFALLFPTVGYQATPR
jgi:hypothetical protein